MGGCWGAKSLQPHYCNPASSLPCMWWWVRQDVRFASSEGCRSWARQPHIPDIMWRRNISEEIINRAGTLQDALWEISQSIS